MSAPVTRAVRRRRSSGLALIVVLWGAALLTLLAAGFSFSTRTEARLSAFSEDRARVAAAAEAGVRRMMVMLASKGRRRFEPVTASMHFDGVEVALRIEPENARIDLNAAPAKLLEGLVAQAGTRLDEAVSAEAISDAILDWRDTDSVARPRGAEAQDYEASGREVGPRNGAFMSVSELSRVMGVTPALYEAIAPVVTVYAWSPQIDAMSASREVLLAVPGLTPAKVDAFIEARRDDAEGSRPVALLAGAERYLARSGTAAVFSLTAHAVAASGVQAARRAVLKLSGNAKRPFSVLAWFEEAEPPESAAGDAAPAKD